MRTKSTLWIIVSIVAGALLIFVSNARAQSDKSETSGQEPRTLSINGSGSVSLKPDIAYINIGVHTERKNAEEAVASNSLQSEKLLNALVRAGVAEKDIQTSNFSIYPRQEWDSQGQPTGVVDYVVDNTVSVTVRELDKVSEVLDAAVQAGANNIYGIQFDIEDREAAQRQAMTAAMDNARERAEVLASAADVKLGDVLSIQTYLSGASPAPYAKAGFDMAQETALSVPVSPGELQITVDISAVFTIQ